MGDSYPSIEQHSFQRYNMDTKTFLPPTAVSRPQRCGIIERTCDRMRIPKEELHRLVDLLPDKSISIAKKFLESIVEKSRSEDISWLDADLTEWPFYDWGPEGAPIGKPVRFVEGKGLVIKEAIKIE